MKSQIVQAREAWWQEHVERWRRRGMSKSGYCATHGLSLNSFRYWLRKSRSSMDAEVPVLKLVAACCYTLDTSADFNEAALSKLLSVLEACVQTRGHPMSHFRARLRPVSR